MTMTGKANPLAKTISPKLKDPSIAPTPAPGAYEPTNADKILDTKPAYTFGLKPEIELKSISPVPGTYHIERSDVILDSQPKYTFGLKPEQAIK